MLYLKLKLNLNIYYSATGSEVSLACIEVAKDLDKQGKGVRVVSVKLVRF